MKWSQPAPARESDADRWWRRACRIEEALAAGDPVSDEDCEWLAENKGEAWYRVRKAAQRQSLLAI